MDDDEPRLSCFQAKNVALYLLEDAQAAFWLKFADASIAWTVFVLVADDFRVLWLPKWSDGVIDALFAICFAFLLAELAVNTWAKSTVTLSAPEEEEGDDERVAPQLATSSPASSPPSVARVSSEKGQASPNSSATPLSSPPPRARSPPESPGQNQNNQKTEQRLQLQQQKQKHNFFHFHFCKGCENNNYCCIQNRLTWEGYVFSFFWWADLLALFSVGLEVPRIVSGLGISELMWKYRTGATWRIVVLVRMIRLVRLCGMAGPLRRQLKVDAQVEDLRRGGILSDEEAWEKVLKNRVVNKQSKLGTELGDAIMRQVVVGVFLLQLLLPLLTYYDHNYTESYSVDYLQSFNLNRTDSVGLSLAVNETIDQLRDYDGYRHLLRLTLQPGDVSCLSIDLEGYRERELAYDSSADWNGDFAVEAVFSHRAVVRRLASSGLLLTLFVAGMLALGVGTFSADARRLVLAPIERMMDIIEYLALDPLQEDADIPQLTSGGDSSGGGYEMRLLETAITKITGLLRVGFGVAGAEIISKNLRIDGSSSSILDPMVPGRRVYSIFGFCDIHRFEHITECLHGEVTLFVNSVAAIVHSATTAWSGQCNKNLGNAFLLTWRIGDAEGVMRVVEIARVDARRGKAAATTAPSAPPSAAHRRPGSPWSPDAPSNSQIGKQQAINSKDADSAAAASAAAATATGAWRQVDVNLQRVPGVETLADKALIAFLKIICEMSTSPSLQAYERHERLAQSPGGFHLSMGFGLHTGWAIEGAVGSVQKVDATYLSPHVNTTARMETASRQYGVSLLLTHDFYQLMSPQGQQRCRKLDVVTVKGSAVPIPVYTYDTHISRHFPARNLSKNFEAACQAEASTFGPHTWGSDRQLVALRAHCTADFLTTFKEGIDAYLAGDWPKAKDCLEHADALMVSQLGESGDGPSRTILSYMRNRDFQAPQGWKGFRELTSK